ncbi:MAG: DUF4249 domain-containing protein [Mucilaginibacter sp.]|uniref:DUF4249 domain-containing protein n=1 Tax=Mucilaginibacter sp. TaxID=1882438 RepID=UPI0034E5E03A
MKTKNISFSTALMMLLLPVIISCQKVVDLKLKDASGQLVVEANVDNNNTSIVKLSQNVAFTSTNTYPPVSGATVTISDQSGKSYTLSEGIAGNYSSGQLQGISLNTYNLTVQTGGKTYTARSTMPPAIALDTITAKNDEFNNGKDRKEISVSYFDPAGIKNQYLFLMYVNGVQVNGIFVYNDDLTDGKHVTAQLRQDDIDVYPGDVVKVEMQCIDKANYTYWFTLEQQQQQGPGGGVTPSNPPSNLSNNALGYFSAHATQTKTIVVK